VSGCGKNPAEPEEEEPPDITGDWVVSVSALFPLFDFNEGTCTGTEFQMTISQTGDLPYGKTYAGSHTGFTTECSGLTGDLKTRYGENPVFTVLPGVLEGEGIYWGECPEGQTPPCTEVTSWRFGLFAADFSLYSDGMVGSGRPTILPGTFDYPRTEWGTFRVADVTGDFSASRR